MIRKICYYGNGIRKYGYVNIPFAVTVFNDRDDSVHHQYIPRSFECYAKA